MFVASDFDPEAVGNSRWRKPDAHRGEDKVAIVPSGGALGLAKSPLDSFYPRPIICVLINMVNRHLVVIKEDLRKFANLQKAKLLSGFFKTGKGESGEGDIFLGVTVPETRSVAKMHKDLPLRDAEKLLESKIHEERLCAILLLVHNYQVGDARKRKEVVDFYLKNTARVNNWDLVDLSAHKILGAYFWDKKSERKTLYKLARSNNLWEKRIAIISTFEFIRNNYFKDSLRIAEILLQDKHDLIHKAVGWMLREVGKHNLKVEEDFLRKHAHRMPRTALRYAIERFPEKKRKSYLAVPSTPR